MSRYLIRRINESPKIKLCTQTEITALEEATISNACTAGEQNQRRRNDDIRHVFVMTGAIPNTQMAG